jgi:enamine deaminase RidA (YjgF/YER057c/UK114 family)
MTESKKVFRSGPYADLIAQGVKVGSTVYLSGQVGMDSAGNIPVGMAEQTAVAYANIRAVLAEFGATMDNIVDETFLVTNLEETHTNLEAIFGARAEAYGRIPEVTQTLFGVAGLLFPEMKIEIKCIAHL